MKTIVHTPTEFQQKLMELYANPDLAVADIARMLGTSFASVVGTAKRLRDDGYPIPSRRNSNARTIAVGESADYREVMRAEAEQAERRWSLAVQLEAMRRRREAERTTA